MAVLVGIDEAGFGPILGPLVVSSSCFSMPAELLGSDLWQILPNSVANQRKRLAGRLLIADSKKAYTRSAGLGHLERTTLSSLSCIGHKPATLGELLSRLCAECCERLEKYHWHKETGGRQLLADAADIEIASRVFADELALNQIKLLKLKSECLDVAYYNKMVDAVKNKASVLFTATSRLIKDACDQFAGEDLQVIVDRQGGRTHYRRNLQMMFPEMELAIITETPKVSSYELIGGNRRMRVHFTVGADIRFLPVSLASMVSKYVRELLMENINLYFRGFYADLKPTAGYWTDGLRFIEDLKNKVGHVSYEREQLIRSR